jgi:hypothetical protein
VSLKLVIGIDSLWHLILAELVGSSIFKNPGGAVGAN